MSETDASEAFQLRLRAKLRAELAATNPEALERWELIEARKLVERARRLDALAKTERGG